MINTQVIPTPEDYKRMLYIRNLRRIETEEVKELQNLYNHYFKENISICNSCKGTIISYHKRFTRLFDRFIVNPDDAPKVKDTSVEPDLNSLKLKELRELYPDIKASNKVDFLKKLETNSSEEE